MYIDETGIGGKFTILSGVIIHSKNYHLFCEEIEKLLINSLGTNKIILKDIRRRRYWSNKSFTFEQYNLFEKGYYEILNKIKPVFIISAVENSWDKNKNLILEKSYEHLLERFHHFLSKNNENGQVVYDRSENYFGIIKKKHNNLIKEGSRWGWKFNLINEIFDKDDCECRLLQVADLLGASMHSYYTFKKDKHYIKCLPFFDKSPDGNVEGYGIKTFP